MAYSKLFGRKIQIPPIRQITYPLGIFEFSALFLDVTWAALLGCLNVMVVT
jgi:hypothetical protein